MFSVTRKLLVDTMTLIKFLTVNKVVVNVNNASLDKNVDDCACHHIYG